jgi:hypothetical protein
MHARLDMPAVRCRSPRTSSSSSRISFSSAFLLRFTVAKKASKLAMSWHMSCQRPRVRSLLGAR